MNKNLIKKKIETEQNVFIQSKKLLTAHVNFEMDSKTFKTDIIDEGGCSFTTSDYFCLLAAYNTSNPRFISHSSNGNK